MTIRSKIDLTQTDLDLLQPLLEEEATYPWNPTQPESVAYLTELETEFELSDCFTDAEVHQRSDIFFSQVEQLYTVTNLQQSLLKRFAHQVPQILLHHLAEAALKVEQKISDSRVSLADQLVECVQEILPQWQAEDLYVLATFCLFYVGSRNGNSR